MMFCLSMKVVLILADSEDPDEMQHYADCAEFHEGIHCLTMYPITSFHYTNGWYSCI